MINTSVRPADDIERVIDTYGNMLFRLCYVMLGSEADSEDVVQETLIRYFQKSTVFKDAEHEKAWLLKVASNRCNDILRYKSRHPHMDIDSVKHIIHEDDKSEILDALMNLPEKYRLVLILYYVEGYHIEEIARIIGRTSSAVKMRLQKGRGMLKKEYIRESV
ncbi:MAG: RNA polymerase sigma factor [Firmicutes bacterium]|nr:RNA polymerase sigma factor [Bacillota bacterium]